MTIRWRGILTLQGFESSDHRILEAVSWRALPLTLRIQTEDFGAHDGASPVSTIDMIELRDAAALGDVLTSLGIELPPGATAAYAEGTFSESEPGQLAAQWVAEKVLRGVSVDPGAIEYVEELIDPSTGDVVSMEQIYETWDQIDAAQILGDEEEAGRLIEWLEALYYRVRFTLYEVAAATLVATPAFGECVIETFEAAVDDAAAPAPDAGQATATAATASRSVAERLAALAGTPGERPTARQRLSSLIQTDGDRHVAAFSPGRMIAAAGAARFDSSRAPVAESDGAARQASARRLAVAVFPDQVFEAETLTAPTKWTIERDGRMHGHLFTWESCHRGFMAGAGARCETPMFLRRDPDFRDFHVGDAHLSGGGKLRVGVLTFAALHAGDAQHLSAAQMTKLMEDTGTQLGPVRLHVDEFGVQACGQVYDDVDPTQAARALAGFPSYDARKIAGRWRLFGLHVVNTPGQTIYEEDEGEVVRMVASIAPTVGPHAAAALASKHGGCGCGGSEGACSCGRPKLSAAALADLALLDRTMRERRALARL